ncbi:MAG: hypothetical protein ABSG81_14735 [Acidimicrobiales bacterium]
MATITTSLAPTPAAADVNSDKAQVAQLGSRIAQDGALVQQLVASQNQAEAKVASLGAQLDVAQAHVAADRQSEARAMAVLRTLALNSYMNGAEDNSALALFDTGNITSLAAEQQYSQDADEGLHSAIDAVEIDQERTQTAETQLRSAQAQAEASVQQLAGAQKAAQGALQRDDTLLSQAQGNLQGALAAAAALRAKEEQEEEEAMAAKAAAAAAAAAASHPVAVSFNPSPGSYADPLRAINALSPERVDQGVDYSGYGFIYAVGDGTIMSTGNSGWPGGTFICYRLSDGPAGGLAVYAGEDIDPTVSVGQSVTAGSVLGTMYEGPDGIETGWADPSCDGVSMANDANQFSGANSTAFGANFSELLASLGAPPGVMQNEPPTGSLPSGWPSW